jgi:DNA-directed RNA polymerase specialized sigma24 family protein
MHFSKLILITLSASLTHVKAYGYNDYFSDSLQARGLDYEDQLFAREADYDDFDFEARHEPQLSTRELKNLYSRDLEAVHEFYRRELLRRAGGPTAAQIAEKMKWPITKVKQVLAVSLT